MGTRFSRLRRVGRFLRQHLRILRRDRLSLGLLTAGGLALVVIATVATGGGSPRPDAVPLTAADAAALAKAAESCTTLTTARLAGQIMATTRFEATADGGIAGLSTDEWERWKPWDDAVASDNGASVLALAYLTCDLVGKLRVSGLSGDLWPLAVAAFASSLDEVRAEAGVPAGVANVVDLAQAYASAYSVRVDPARRTEPVPRPVPDNPPTGDPTTTGTPAPTPSSAVTTEPASPAPAPTSIRSNAFSIAIGPTSASVVQGSTATSVVTTAVTAGSAQPIALSAAGLPAGTTASFSPATVTAGGSSTLTLRTSSSTPASTSTVTVTAIATGSVTRTASLSLTVTPAYTCSSGQKLDNPGFESGSSPWVTSAGVIDNSSAYSPRSGRLFAKLGGYGETKTSYMYQTVSLPSGCVSYTFSYWLLVDSDERTSSTVYDRMTVQVLNSSGSVLRTLATYTNLDDGSGYKLKSFDLKSYAGQTIRLKFTVSEDYSRQTSFIVDDTALEVA